MTEFIGAAQYSLVSLDPSRKIDYGRTILPNSILEHIIIPVGR